MNILHELATRNFPLYIFGWVCLTATVITGVLIQTTTTEVLGINAFIKPFKFFLSTVIFTWSMAWYLGYLPATLPIKPYTWVVIAVLSFELFWITYKASISELSHFNGSSAFNSFMFSMMGLTISIMTLYTLYIGLLFFGKNHAELPPPYLWGIRLGIIFFVIFAFEGGIMGALMSHTVGATDGGKGLPLVNWSTSHGDLRIAHFVGMHALQVLPLVGFYVFSSARSTILFSILYFTICASVLIQALMKIPLFKG